MESAVAAGLKDALADLERTRIELETATSSSSLVEKATAYQQARRDAGPAFDAAQRAFEADQREAGLGDPVPEGSGPDPDPDASPAPTEASPGVALVAAPGEVVNAANLGRFGPLVPYTPKASESEVAQVSATPYAFAEGTAVATPEGVLAISQPSRIIVSDGVLGIVSNDVFNQNYEPAPAETVSELPEGGQYPNGPDAGEVPAQDPTPEGSS